MCLVCSLLAFSNQDFSAFIIFSSDTCFCGVCREGNRTIWKNYKATGKLSKKSQIFANVGALPLRTQRLIFTRIFLHIIKFPYNWEFLIEICKNFCKLLLYPGTGYKGLRGSSLYSRGKYIVSWK